MIVQSCITDLPPPRPPPPPPASPHPFPLVYSRLPSGYFELDSARAGSDASIRPKCV